MSKRTKKTTLPIPEIVDPNLPRRLTEEEIERAIAAVPYPHAVTHEHSVFAREQILQIVRVELMAIELTPSGLDELIERIVNQFEESRVKPGSMVGFAAAEAPSARFSQDNLSAVHRAGSVGMQATGGAVDRISDLVSKQQSKAASKYDACTVFFKDIQTQHSILHDKRADMVAINISALLQVGGEYSIEYHSVLFPDGKLPTWYYIYSELNNIPLPNLEERDNGKILRLHLDLERIVEYRVLVSELLRALMSSNSRVLRYFISPMHMGIVDIWALDEEFHSYGLDISGDPELDVFNTLHGFAVRLGMLYVKGIPGIRDVQAAKFDVWPIMTMGQSSRKLRDNVYEYRLTSIWPMRFGWDRARLLWHHLGILVQDYDQNNSSWVVLDGVSAPPHEIIRNAVDADKKDADNWQRAAVAAGKSIVTRPVTPANTSYWSEHWYAKTEGTNLREISVRDDVDPRFTISNRPFEVLEIYGIVAARRVMLEELYLAFGPGTRDEPNFSVRHFSLLADFVCHTGLIRPISNLLIQGRSTLSKSTFSRQFNTLVVPAIHGIDEPLGDVSAAIMVASRARIGPRAFEYEGGINKGSTAEEIKQALRSGSRSTAEIDKLIGTMSETTDIPLYSTGAEGIRSADEAAAMSGAHDEDAEAEAEMLKEYEASAANLPPGLDMDEDEDGEPIGRHKIGDDDLIIEDEIDETLDFGERREEEEEVKPARRRSSRAPRKPVAPTSSSGRAVVMAPALSSAIKSMGATVVPAVPEPPPAPACSVPRRSALRKDDEDQVPPRRTRTRARTLTFVNDD